MTDIDLLLALRDCYDPLLKRDIVSLGLVRSATLTAARDAPGAGIPGVPARFLARITLTAPTQDEAANALLASLIENRLAGLPEIFASEISIVPPLLPILRF